MMIVFRNIVTPAIVAFLFSLFAMLLWNGVACALIPILAPTSYWQMLGFGTLIMLIKGISKAGEALLDTEDD